MAAQQFRGLIDALGQAFGHFDNQVEKWADLGADLAGYDPQIRDALLASFGANSAPVQIFAGALAQRRSLADALSEQSLSTEDHAAAAGYLNLRFYIYLNGFLQACAESLEKASYNSALDAAELVEKSYYKPYFFERVTLTTEDVIAMLEADLARLAEAPQDKKGIVLAFRIRKGLVSTFVESYCPTHPWHYPPVARLDAIKPSTDPAVIGEIQENIAIILGILREA